MKFSSRLFVLSVIISGFLWAIAPSSAMTEERPTCAVLSFHPDEASAEFYESRYITNRYAELIEELGIYDVLKPADISSRLPLEEVKVAETCTDQNCAVDIGKKLKVDYIIYGIIGHIGRIYSLDTVLIDVQTGKVVNSAVTDFIGARDEFAVKAPPRNIKSLLVLSKKPALWKDATLSDKKEEAEPAEAAAEEEATETVSEGEPSESKALHVGPRLGVGYSDDGLEIGLGAEVRLNNLSFKVLANDIGIGTALSYYVHAVGNSPYASLVWAYYDDDPHGVDEIGRIYGALAGYRINVNENLDACLGVGAGWVNWDQTEFNNDGVKQSDEEWILIGELTIGYMF